MVKDRCFGGVNFFPQMWQKSFLFVSEMPNHFIAPFSNSAFHFEGTVFSFTKWSKASYVEQNVLSVFNFDSEDRFLVCTPNKKLCLAWLQQEPVPCFFV